MSRPADRPIVLEVFAALLVPAGAFGFIRVFVEIGDVTPIIGASLMSSALAVALRRLRVPLALAAIVSLASISLLLIARYAPGTSRYLIVPTGDTVDELRLLVDDGLERFRALRAPVPALPPFIAATMIAAWIMAFLTDWGAHRLRLAFEPVLPAGLLFIFSAVLGDGSRRILSTVVFAAAVVAWAVAQRAMSLARATWLSADRQRGPAGVARSAALVGMAVLLGGLLVGPRLPGAGEEELYYWRNRTDPTRQAISPFVEISNRLVEQQDVDLFRVTSSQPTYWRLTGLDTYKVENAQWTTEQNFTETSGPLPGSGEQAGTTVELVHTIEIQGLSGIWLPAAYAPAEVLSADDATIWNPETASLALTRDSANPSGEDSLYEGLRYTLVSQLQLHTADELRAAPDTVPADIAERFVGVPAGVTDRVLSEALAITAGASTRYDQALALQDHFQQFDYSTSLSRRQGDPIEQFLDERVGFCQQFSGTFALMARSLGIPTRVAVGFTWGDPVEGEADTYQVTGRHTHAWPEVWFAGLGWVAFEPTPGRGAPNADYTNLSERQDSLVQEDLSDSITPTTQPETGSTTTSLDLPEFLEDQGAFGDTDAGSGGGSASPLGPVWVRGLLLAGLAYLIGAPMWFRLRRARRHRSAATDADRVEALWADAADDLDIHFGLRRGPAETRTEFARRAGGDARVPVEALATLADVTTVARFAGAVSPGSFDQASAAAADIDARVRSRTRARQRWLRQADPRRLLRPTGRPVRPAVRHSEHDDASESEPTPV